MYTQLPNDALRETANLSQIYPSFITMRRQIDNYAGGMSWKTVNGRDYLIRTHNRSSIQKSLGPRSEKTEAKFAEFHRGKEDAEQRFSEMVGTIDRYAAIAKALSVGSIPIEAANILRALDRRGLLGGNLAVAGTHSLYAYEALAGVRFRREIMQTDDLDLFWDARTRLRLRYWGDNEPSIRRTLLEADKSFQQVENMPYRLIGRSGFLVDLIKNEGDPPWTDKDSMSPGDIPAAPISTMRWIANAPKVVPVTIDLDGYPTRIAAADPRAFALFKLWLSEQPDRDPVKRPRDRAQALAVAALVRDKLRHLAFTPDQLKMFPAEVVEATRRIQGFWRVDTTDDSPLPAPKSKKRRRSRGFSRR
ncbi:MAG: GSU2403 family nucleotidyltransferase fold protein [Myxococcota bacterium]